MKFQCDRCKTRYSIADERVRGKILKIRCKNCEAVITVREGMDLARAGGKAAAAKAPSKPAAKAPTVDSKPVLRGAFERAMDSTQREEPPGDFADDDQTVISDPPPQLEEEWYVSLDGEQYGPFSLQQARNWVAVRPPHEELYCWSEGFDDWQLVERVSQFRRVRSEPRPAAALPRPGPQAPAVPAAAAQAPSGGVVPAAEDTPKPLFAAALDKLERDENPAASAEQQRGPTNGQSAAGDGAGEVGDSEFDFDIGEASRVVRLPAAVRGMRPSSGGSQPSYLPGMADDDSGRIGAGTGGHASVGKLSGGQPVVVPLSAEAQAAESVGVLQPQVHSKMRQSLLGRHMILFVGIGALAVVVTIMAVIAVGNDDEGDSGRLVRSRAGADGLGVSLDPRTIKIVETREVPTKGGGSRRGRGRVRGGGNDDSGGSNLFGKTDDFDFGSGNDEDRPLDGDDLMKVYRDNRLAVKLCYERALKKDPLLDVTKIYVNLTVSPQGVVTKVLLSSHQDSALGTCLVQRMRRWRFRKSPETFSGRFPLVFRK